MKTEATMQSRIYDYVTGVPGVLVASGLFGVAYLAQGWVQPEGTEPSEEAKRYHKALVVKDN